MLRRRSIHEISAFLTLTLIIGCAADPVGGEEGPSVLAAGPGVVVDPGLPGPYQVGVRTVWLEDPTRVDPENEDLPRRFRVEIWYPAVDSAAEGEHDLINAMDETPESLSHLLDDVEILEVAQPAFRDAQPRADQGLFPVVLFSHGLGAVRYQSFTYTTHLASHGYVVLAPDHVGNTLFDMLAETNPEGSILVSLVDRPLDLSLILDRLEDGDLTSGWLEPLVDLDNTVVTGHSYGGLISVLITHPGSEFFDARFMASVPITPATQVLSTLGAGDLSQVEVPVLYVGATEDRTLDYQLETVDAYDAHSPDKAMVGVIDAGHYSFTEVCDMGVADAARDVGLEGAIEATLRDGCGEQNIPVEVAYQRLCHYAAAWLNTYVRGSVETADIHLDPGVAPGDVVYRLDRR